MSRADIRTDFQNLKGDREKSSANGTVTRPRGSRWPPTSTSCPACRAEAAHTFTRVLDLHATGLLAYVLIHNDAGGPHSAAIAVTDRFANDITGETCTALDALASNFTDPEAQGPQAYAESVLDLHPDLDWDLLANDAVTAIAAFIAGLDSDAQRVNGE